MEGRKKNAYPISLFFWETPFAGKRSSWLVRHREVDWCLSINCKSILFIPFPSVFWNWSGWECSVYILRNEKVKGISTLVIRTRFARSTKTCSTFTSCQNAACSNMFCIWRVDYALANVILAACFTPRSHDTLIDFLWFLNFWSPWFALWCKSVFFDFFWSVKLFLSLNKAVRFFIFV